MFKSRSLCEFPDWVFLDPACHCYHCSLWLAPNRNPCPPVYHQRQASHWNSCSHGTQTYHRVPTSHRLGALWSAADYNLPLGLGLHYRIVCAGSWSSKSWSVWCHTRLHTRVHRSHTSKPPELYTTPTGLYLRNSHASVISWDPVWSKRLTHKPRRAPGLWSWALSSFRTNILHTRSSDWAAQGRRGNSTDDTRSSADVGYVGDRFVL